MGVEAQQQANNVTADANGPFRTNMPTQYLFNDPAVHAKGGDDASFQAKGKLYDTVGIAMDVVGGVAAVAGVALIVADVMKHRGGGDEKPKKDAPRAGRRVVVVCRPDGRPFAGRPGRRILLLISEG